MAADIRNIDDDIEVRRFADLTRTYRQRLADLAKLRERLVLADSVDDIGERAAALVAGVEFTAPRSLASIGDEEAVLRRAIARTEDAERDARAQAAVAISRECRLPEQAGQLRENIAVAIDNLLDALAASDRFADELEAADVSATGVRWPGRADERLTAMLAGLRLDLGVATDDGHELERRAGRRGEAVVELQARPAPVVAKQTIRKRVTDKLGEIGEQMFV
jgi:hypothetical protein